MDIRLPYITAKDTEGKMVQMQSYMRQLVEQLNWALATMESAIGGNTVTSDSTNGIKNGTVAQVFAEDVLAFAESCSPGFTPFYTEGSTTNVPATGNYLNASGFVHKRTESNITVFIISYDSGDLAINTYYETAGGWLGWRYLHTTTT